MLKDTENTALRILEEANKHGVKVFGKGDRLHVVKPVGKEIPLDFIDRLKAYKSILLNYLTLNRTTNHDLLLERRSDILCLNDIVYYKIPAEHNSYWWVNNQDLSFKKRLLKNIAFRIGGDLNVERLELATNRLVERHEILRTKFHQINQVYYMSVATRGDVIFEYRELACTNSSKDAFINFRELKIDLHKGPFFQVRLLKEAVSKYILAIQIHHCIADAWSLEVLIRDLLIVYLSLEMEKDIPDLAPLRYQYKDLAYLETTLNSIKGKDQKQYWMKKFMHVPPDFIIPGEERKGTGVRVLGRRDFTLLPNVVRFVLTQSRQRSCSTFVILQALFKYYILQLTGQTDLIVGTMTFNRDLFENMEDQIGAYAKTRLIRTVLEEGDSFDYVLEKVVRSNQEMEQNRYFPLLQFMEEHLADGNPINGTFWKVNLYYQDEIGFMKKDDLRSISKTLSIHEIEVDQKVKSININIEIRFIARREDIYIVVSYDKNLYSSRSIDVFVKGYIETIEKCSQDKQ